MSELQQQFQEWKNVKELIRQNPEQGFLALEEYTETYGISFLLVREYNKNK